MSTEFTSSTGYKKLDDAAVKYIISLFKEGKDSGFIVSNMVQNGYNYDETYNFVTALEFKIKDAQQQRETKNAPWGLIWGIIILIIGLVVTFSGAGVIAYGAILVGIVRIITSIANLSK